MQIVFGSTQAKGVKVSHLHAMSSGSKINWLRRHFHRNFPTQPFALIYMHNIQIGQEVGQKLCKSSLSSGFPMQNNNKGLPSKCLCVQFFFFYWFLKSWDLPVHLCDLRSIGDASIWADGLNWVPTWFCLVANIFTGGHINFVIIASPA